MINHKLKQILIVFLMGVASTSLFAAQNTQAIYQAGTLLNLANGIYDGTTTLTELTSHGTFGLGTIDGAKGELVVIDGKPYLGEIDKNAEPIPGSTTTPFAMIVDFKPSIHFSLNNVHSLDELEKQIDAKLPSNNIFYAIKISGDFNEITMRDFPAATKPYIPLDQWIKQHQVIYHLKNSSGTLVAFKCPNYINPISVAGYHLHYINQAHTQVGHVYDVQFSHAEVSIEPIYHFDLILPSSAAFLKNSLQMISNESVQKLEKNK